MLLFDATGTDESQTRAWMLLTLRTAELQQNPGSSEITGTLILPSFHLAMIHC